MSSSSSKRNPQRAISDTPHYHTFPTSSQQNGAKPLAKGLHSTNGIQGQAHHTHGGMQTESPLPVRQLFILAIIALAEQTALNSISPYLPDMASKFPEVKDGEVGVYVGLIASAFALAQFATNYFWGWLSDRIGRKPVILTGTILTAACFSVFGYCKTLWQAILVQALMGLVNGNQGVVSTCLGEITDRSNQSKAFIYLPVVYGVGGITGPIVGGLLVNRSLGFGSRFPYLLPNLVSAVLLLLDAIITYLFLEESMETANDLIPLSERVGSLFSWLWQFTGSSQRPTYARLSSNNHTQGVERDNDDMSFSDSNSQSSEAGPSRTGSHGHLRARDVLNRDVVLILATYFIFQLSNIAYNSLYPIFAQAAPPVGRGLTPQEIGVSLAFAGVITIGFQIGVFGRLRGSIGNRTTYRICLAGFVLAFLLMPWVGYKAKDGKLNTSNKVWFWAELGGVLIIKTVAAVGGLTSALLLITNSARDHTVLGALNGLAQTLSAAGRAAGPFISGGLFSISTQIHPKGEVLAFGIFGGVSFIGFLMSFGIRGPGLEDSGWNEVEGEADGPEEDNEIPGRNEDLYREQFSVARGEGEQDPLLNGTHK